MDTTRRSRPVSEGRRKPPLRKAMSMGWLVALAPTNPVYCASPARLDTGRRAWVRSVI